MYTTLEAELNYDEWKVKQSNHNVAILLNRKSKKARVKEKKIF